jgi:alternate signal-mediated exported protein
MNRTTKGALAAGAAGALLLGGAGTLAYWHDNQDVGTAQIRTGSLTLGAPVCADSENAQGLHGWQLDNGAPYVPGTTRLVPGDSISKVCDLPLTLVGEHIGADLAIDDAELTSPSSPSLVDELHPSATFTINGDQVTSVTEAGVYTVRATVSVEFTGAAATNASQDGDVDLDKIDITATQTHRGTTLS